VKRLSENRKSGIQEQYIFDLGEPAYFEVCRQRRAEPVLDPV
jgi:hypothetical protein